MPVKAKRQVGNRVIILTSANGEEAVLNGIVVKSHSRAHLCDILAEHPIRGWVIFTNCVKSLTKKEGFMTGTSFELSSERMSEHYKEGYDLIYKYSRHCIANRKVHGI